MAMRRWAELVLLKVDANSKTDQKLLTQDVFRENLDVNNQPDH